MGDQEQLVVRVVPQIAAIDPADWDRCAAFGDQPSPDCDPDNPFIRHAFLQALEESGSATVTTGWAPQHMVLESAGEILGCMPCYLKSHSQGEYVFDHGWADAFERAGGRYYPKYQISVPFTPVTGRRILVPSGPAAEFRRDALLSGALQMLNRHDISSIHLTFLTKQEWAGLGDIGSLRRTDRQFHWHNDGYETFDEFLAQLAARKRKVIRKERRGAMADGVTIEWLTGDDLTEDIWDAFYAFYMDTGARKWGRPYLTRTFFSLIGERMADRIVLVLCRLDGEPVAGALNFIGADTIYGRYWGATMDIPFLHFEACYYQAIDYAIAHGLNRVEAGAQGPHKIARGYLPETTYSAHYIADPRLREAVSEYLDRERSHVELEDRALSAHAPFRKTGGSD